jgi:hypothetical protein
MSCGDWRSCTRAPHRRGGSRRRCRSPGPWPGRCSA